MALTLVPRSARALADHLNSIYRTLKGIDPDQVWIRLPGSGTFEVRHSATNTAVFRVTDAGIVSSINGAQIVDGTILSQHISNGTIVGADIAAATITPDKLTGATGIPAGAITTVEILDGTIKATDVEAGQLPMLLSAQTVSSPISALTIAVPSTYRHLEILIVGRSTAAVVSEAVGIRPNSDATPGNYWSQQLAVSGTTSTASQPTALTYATVGVVPGASAASALWFGTSTVRINGYASAFYKPITAQSYANTDASGLGNQSLRVHGAVWAITNPITSVSVLPATGNWAVGTQISVVGIP